ncbi:MAG TPA: DUF4760 domain-containing protein [Longimicrobiaceae bacterium]|nr:DUF4760 domain-containing protein [Longimicrobiaceae bacterium]
MEVIVGAVSIVVSVLIAVWSVLATHRKDRSVQQIAHTANILANLSTSERLAESSYQLTRLINAGATVSMSGIDPATEAHVVDVLDYYEFLCDLYENGIVNRGTVREIRGQLMKRTWTICEPYIMETRELQGRRVYSGLERFVEDLRTEERLSPDRHPKRLLGRWT